ncbi:hypothetical protein [Lactobacillus paragasseri]|uniref:hypothetical protein n=1 Tax=Lactobacillus paragasseri TaxID=2107999 RepID=UPI001194B521|nr:hypothetical protein [Lactobacillus paragasseri]MDK7250907.1 hypothetical protein [Lactobacillus paragasseri]TVV08090.1 hypothetical protein FOF73_03465 [Lactobacillus paragasseri]
MLATDNKCKYCQGNEPLVSFDDTPIQIYMGFNEDSAEDTYEDIEVDDNATEEEIENVVKETAFEHFEYGYEILTTKEKK